ncbi:MAG: BNR-4 repeat-containing protein [Hyphomicrobiales bacterium]
MNRWVPAFRFAPILILLNIIIAKPVDAASAYNCSNIVIDKVWSGAPARIAVISTSDAVYAAYYNQFRYITAAKIDLANCMVERKPLSSRYGGYDTHNYISMIFDEHRILHISGNMHNVPLVYYRAKRPFDIESLSAALMTGVNEKSVTYPTFFMNNSNLYFMYRDGYSGSGSTYINKLEDHLATSKANESWTKLTDRPIFADHALVNAISTPVSAYPSPMVRGQDNYYHYAIDWRQTGDVATNFAVSYVKTMDFITWFDAAGKKLKLPISFEQINPSVTVPGLNNGLVNSVKVDFTTSRKPVILYTRYANTNLGLRNGIYASIYEDGKWTAKLLATSTNLIDIKGSGSLSFLPYFSTFSHYGAVSRLTYQFHNEPRQHIDLDAETLMPTNSVPVIAPVQSISPSPVAVLPGLESDPLVALQSAAIQTQGGPLVSVRWRSLPANNDRPFSCPPSPAAYCNPPPSDLILDTLWPK